MELPFNWEQKRRIASVFIQKCVALIRAVYSNAFFGSVKHTGTITEGILVIPIKYNIFPKNKFIPVIMLRGREDTHVVFKISDTLFFRVEKGNIF